MKVLLMRKDERYKVKKAWTSTLFIIFGGNSQDLNLQYAFYIKPVHAIQNHWTE